MSGAHSVENTNTENTNISNTTASTPPIMKGFQIMKNF